MHRLIRICAVVALSAFVAMGCATLQTPEVLDEPGEVSSAGGYVTNPSTPVVTLYQGDREVTAVCVTWRRLERLDEPMARRKVAEMIWKCAEISAGRRPTPTHRV